MAQVKLISVRETAKRLGVHENTVRNWEAKGILRAVRLPGSGFRRFDLEQVDRMWKEMTSLLAPADKGPVVKPRVPVRGRVVHGDL